MFLSTSDLGGALSLQSSLQDEVAQANENPLPRVVTSGTWRNSWPSALLHNNRLWLYHVGTKWKGHIARLAWPVRIVKFTSFPGLVRLSASSLLLSCSDNKVAAKKGQERPLGFCFTRISFVLTRSPRVPPAISGGGEWEKESGGFCEAFSSHLHTVSSCKPRAQCTCPVHGSLALRCQCQDTFLLALAFSLCYFNTLTPKGVRHKRDQTNIKSAKKRGVHSYLLTHRSSPILASLAHHN